jgi:hypothetical protein
LAANGIGSAVLSFCFSHIPFVPPDWIVQTMDDALVGRCAKSQKNHQGLWNGCPDMLCLILGPEFNIHLCLKFFSVFAFCIWQ